MPSQGGGGQSPASELALHVALMGHDPAHLNDAASVLEAAGYRISRVVPAAGVPSWPSEASPDLIVVDGGPDYDSKVLEPASAGGIPVLAILDTVPGSDVGMDRYGAITDWVMRSQVRAELPARAAGLLGRHQRAARTTRVPADARFFSLVIHDLRTPLNVIGLSLRMIGQGIPKGDPELDEDLRFVEENFKQIERMLALLSDYFRLCEGDEPLDGTEFSPQRLLAEILESRALKLGPSAASIRLDVQATCPAAVALDRGRARLGIQHALTNAVAAAADRTVLVTLRGTPGRWVIEIATQSPPPVSVQPTALRSHVFERLCGNAAERRGMDLAIAARVTEVFGGEARLDVVADSGTTLVFDWPDRLPESAPSGT